jgi:hypothetical protein
MLGGFFQLCKGNESASALIGQGRVDIQKQGVVILDDERIRRV